MMLAQRFMHLQRLPTPLASTIAGRLLPVRAAYARGPLLCGNGVRSSPTLSAVRSNAVIIGSSTTTSSTSASSASCVFTIPQQGYRSASGTNKLKAKLKAKHRRAKGGANPRGKSQLPKGQRKSRKKPLPGRR